MTELPPASGSPGRGEPTPRESDLLRALVDMADGLVNTYDTADLLYRLTAHCVQLLAAGAAGILLVDVDQTLRVAAASSEDLRTIQLLAVAGENGPCVRCCTTGQPVYLPDLTTAADRWPDWVQQAQAQGYRSAYATPMRLRDTVIGALTIVATSQSALPAADLLAARALADVATITLLTQRAADRAETVNGQLQTALSSRVVLEQAKGVIATVAGVTMDQAFHLLRGNSRATNTRLADVAASVVTGQLTAADLIGGRDPNRRGRPR